MPNWTFFTKMKQFYYTPPFLIYRTPVLFCSSFPRINFVNSPKLQFRGLSSLYISWDFSRASSCSIWFYCRTLQEKKCRFSPLFGGKNVLEGAKNDNRIFFFPLKISFHLGLKEFSCPSLGFLSPFVFCWFFLLLLIVAMTVWEKKKNQN
jgi:hypothetical protein